MKTVFFDIDTQLDFVNPAGALYVPGAELRIPVIAGLNRLAVAKGIPLVSTVDAHSESDAEFRDWPHHCIAGTLGQRKAEATLLEKRVVIPNRACDLAISGAQQIVVEKQNVNAFTAPNFLKVVEALGAEHCVVYGVVTEVCVWHAATGLLQAGRKVTVVTDAIETLNAGNSEKALAENAARGGKLDTSACVMSSV